MVGEAAADRRALLAVGDPDLDGVVPGALEAAQQPRQERDAGDNRGDRDVDGAGGVDLWRSGGGYLEPSVGNAALISSSARVSESETEPNPRKPPAARATSRANSTT